MNKKDLPQILAKIAEDYSFFDEEFNFYVTHKILPTIKDLENLILSSNKVDALIRHDNQSFIIYKTMPRRYEVEYTSGDYFIEWLKKNLYSTDNTRIIYNVPDFCTNTHLMLKKMGFKAKDIMRNYKEDVDFIKFIYKKEENESI